MTNLQRVEKVTERILNLTLEIIYLLTGEDYTVVKKTSCDHVASSTSPCLLGRWSWRPITELPPSSLTPNRKDDLKILEVTQKIIELLTGEVPIRCQDVTVYFSMEEWEYIEGHKDLYKDVMMENRPPLTSPDGSRNGNPPERCPRPLYSWDSTQEHQEILREDQVDGSSIGNPPERCPRPLYSWDSTQEHQEIPREDQVDGSSIGNPPERDPHPLYSWDSTQEHQEDQADGSSNGNPPERCPRPLYSRDPTQEHQEIPQEDQVDGTEDLSDNLNQEESVISKDFEEEDVIVIKVEDLYDEEMGGDMTCAVEDIPPEISPDRRYKRYQKKKRPFSAPDDTIKDDPAADYAVVNSTSCNLRQGWQSVGESFTYKGRLPALHTHHVPEGEDKAFLCLECGKCFSKQSSLDRHRQLMHIWEKPYSCSECDKRFGHKISLVRHQRIHNNENTFSCPLCGRCFAQKSHLVEHERQHTGEKPYACMECGKRFAVKRALVSHESTHAGQKQFCCPECGKCFSRRAYLFSHQRVHLRHKMV